jgi:hypothetical protein
MNPTTKTMPIQANDRRFYMEKREMKDEVVAIIEAAYKVSEDVGSEVEEALRLGREQPLDQQELQQLLVRIVTSMKTKAAKTGRPTTLKDSVEDIVKQIMINRETIVEKKKPETKVELSDHNGIRTGPVFPRPMFHEKEIPMNSGWVRTTDIGLWPDNERLEIHVAQFRHQHGRKPNSTELLNIMMSKMPLRGITKDDEFEIIDLARSIATNGVRKPPIIDLNGTLLDGNRRVTACYYILNNDDFDASQKKNAEYVFVWQLTEYADDDDRDKVVVSLNFEKDLKKDWPDYIKARKVYAEYEAMLGRVGTREPTAKQELEIRRQIARRFALGTNEVTRYLKMMDWADAFEGYHVEVKNRDEFEVKHRTDDAFQYFDEMSKGYTDGGVSDSLKQDDTLRHAVFDLLFHDRFKNWKQIRDLKHVAKNEDARTLLLEAAEVASKERAEELLDTALSMAKTRTAEERVVGADTRIEQFVKWLRDLPVSAFTERVSIQNLRRLLEALELVKDIIAQVLKMKEASDGGESQ